uniref:Uncharacterized protein n=1 Tax=Glossina pallidipes TaxID=7398 RepID=A0A1A9ZPT5_GLOPL
MFMCECVVYTSVSLLVLGILNGFLSKQSKSLQEALVGACPSIFLMRARLMQAYLVFNFSTQQVQMWQIKLITALHANTTEVLLMPKSVPLWSPLNNICNDWVTYVVQPRERNAFVHSLSLDLLAYGGAFLPLISKITKLNYLNRFLRKLALGYAKFHWWLSPLIEHDTIECERLTLRGRNVTHVVHVSCCMEFIKKFQGKMIYRIREEVKMKKENQENRNVIKI